MKHPTALLLLALAAATVLPAQAQLLPQAQGQGDATASGTQPLDRIIAVVDDNVILQSELDDAVRSVRQQYASTPDRLPPEDVLKRQVLDRLVLMKLQVAKANERDGPPGIEGGWPVRSPTRRWSGCANWRRTSTPQPRTSRPDNSRAAALSSVPAGPASSPTPMC